MVGPLVGTRITRDHGLLCQVRRSGEELPLLRLWSRTRKNQEKIQEKHQLVRGSARALHAVNQKKKKKKKKKQL